MWHVLVGSGRYFVSFQPCMSGLQGSAAPSGLLTGEEDQQDQHRHPSAPYSALPCSASRSEGRIMLCTGLFFFLRVFFINETAGKK